MIAPLERQIKSFLNHLRVERGLAQNSLLSYGRDLTKYCDFILHRGISSAEEITQVDITEFVRQLSNGTAELSALSRSSIARNIVAIRNFHKFALEEGISSHNPAINITPPKLAKRLPKALTIKQIQQLLDSIDTNDVIGLRDVCMFELLYATGARISEICRLDVDEMMITLSDDNTGLRLMGKGSKQRIVPLGNFARKATENYLVRARPELAKRAKISNPALLLNKRGARLSRQSAWESIQLRAKTAKLEVELSPHSFRHSFATHLLDGGADIRVVQELLGHSSVATTQIYTLVTIEGLREVYRSSHPRAF